MSDFIHGYHDGGPTKDFDAKREDFVLIDGDYKSTDELSGWLGEKRPDLLRDAFDMFGDHFPDLEITTGWGEGPYKTKGRSMLWEVVRVVLGSDIPTIAQLIGDCVGAGGTNAGQYTQIYPIANGERHVYTSLYIPYTYGVGRALIGRSRSRGDGSLGIWQAEGVNKYGMLPVSYPNLPPYTKQSAVMWSALPGPPEELVAKGKEHVIKSIAKVRTWEQFCSALDNGYPVPLASSIGYDMQTRSDGFNHHSTRWDHLMCGIGYDDGDGNEIEPHACILNTWGARAHNQITDFRTKANWPAGTLRVRKKDLLLMLQADDSFTYSPFDNGFPAQILPRDIFSLI